MRDVAKEERRSQIAGGEIQRKVDAMSDFESTDSIETSDLQRLVKRNRRKRCCKPSRKYGNVRPGIDEKG